jgi:hypothetical protein
MHKKSQQAKKRKNLKIQIKTKREQMSFILESNLVRNYITKLQQSKLKAPKPNFSLINNTSFY